MNNIRDIYFRYKDNNIDVINFYKEVDRSMSYTADVIADYIEQGSIIDKARLVLQGPGRVYCGLKSFADMFLNSTYNENTKTWDTTHAEVMDKLLKQFAEKQVALTDIVGIELCYEYYTKYDN